MSLVEGKFHAMGNKTYLLEWTIFGRHCCCFNRLVFGIK